MKNKINIIIIGQKIIIKIIIKMIIKHGIIQIKQIMIY